MAELTTAYGSSKSVTNRLRQEKDHSKLALQGFITKITVM
jgi:hypothetical protein